MKHMPMVGLLTVALCILSAAFAVGADVYVGAMVHPWFGYPSAALELGSNVAYTVAPTLSFSAGFLDCMFWYGADPNRTGYLCVQDSFGVPAGNFQTLAAATREYGWRIRSSGPLHISASVSRLHWAAAGLCNDQLFSQLTATQVAAGAGVRIPPIWASAEYGVQWVQGSADFTDINPQPVGNLILSFGFETRINPIAESATRFPVKSFAVEFEEDFGLGCESWDWEGQAGYVRVIDEQLGIVVQEKEEAILKPFGASYERCVIDLDAIPRSTGSSEHSFGVFVRYREPGDHYCVEIRTDGYVRFTRTVDGAFEPLTPWRRTVALREGERNALRVILPGNRVVAYLNGRKILDEEEVSFVDGDVGVFAKSYDEPGTWTAFDNIEIRPIGANFVLDPRSEQAKDIEQFERVGMAALSSVAAYIAARENLPDVSTGLLAISLYELLRPSDHLLEVW